MNLRCEFCGHQAPHGEMRAIREGFACADTAACDRRDAERERREVAELRAQARRGEELTEAERQRL